MHKNEIMEMVTWTVGCVCVAAVLITIVLSIYYGTTNSSVRYHASMSECIQARGTWVPSINTGSCVINNQ